MNAPTSALSISVVVPAHNEERTIEAVVRDVAATVPVVIDAGGAATMEMIVVDDASTDATPAIVDTLAAEFPWLRLIRLNDNVGHGPAVARGLRAARGTWIFQLDADAQFVVADFEQLWERRHGADLVIGIRAVRHDAGHRLVLSKAAALATSVMARRRLRDVNSPFRLFRRMLWDDVSALAGDAPSIPSVLTCIVAARMKASIVEVPVRHLTRPHGRSTLNVKRLAPLVARGLGEAVAASRQARPASVRSLGTDIAIRSAGD